VIVERQNKNAPPWQLYISTVNRDKPPEVSGKANTSEAIIGARLRPSTQIMPRAQQAICVLPSTVPRAARDR